MTNKLNLSKRIIANVLDYSLVFMTTIVYIMFFGEEIAPDYYQVEGLFSFFLLPIFWFTYFIIIESIWGATVGFQALHLVVRKKDGTRIGFGEAFVRHLFDIIEILPFGIIAILSIAATDKKQRLGDLAAGTIVIDLTDEEQYPFAF